MSREIKFKAWVQCHSGKFIMISPEQVDVDFAAIKKTENCTLLQFTGLQDSNGDELYEKDMVYLAGYGNYVCEFPFITLYEAADEGDIGEKLGNVLENPELGL